MRRDQYSAGRNKACVLYSEHDTRRYPRAHPGRVARMRTCNVIDTTGGGDHFDATVVSSAFSGKGAVSVTG